MFSTRAHSFRQQSKLAVCLSWVGGYTNVVTLLTTGWVCSHMSGTTTAFGKAIAQTVAAGASNAAAGETAASGGITASIWFLGFVLFCFWLGALFSGLMTEWSHRKRRRSKYLLSISVEAWLLAMFSIGMTCFYRGALGAQWQVFLMVGIAATAMGLQNATITHISGAVVRTTHVTGVVTDLGLEISQYLVWFRDQLRNIAHRQRLTRICRLLRISRRRTDALRILLLGGLFTSFLLGVTVGTLAFHYCFTLCLWPPVAFLILILVKDSRTPTAKIERVDPSVDAEFRLLDIGHHLLPPQLGIYRLASRQDDTLHRAPSFEAWATRLPRDWRVVILTITAATVQLTSNALADLELAHRSLVEQDQQLILCGISSAQYRALRQHGLLERLGRENVLPDLEFAVARAMEIA